MTESRSSIPGVFVARCRVCQYEIEVEWGPETHRIALELLADHIYSHRRNDLALYVLRQHGVAAHLREGMLQ